jgi:hypothetical protein
MVLLVNVDVPLADTKVGEPDGSVALVVPVVVNVNAFAPDVISELPSTNVSVADVVGAVMVTLLIDVAVATPSVGVVNDGEIKGA